MIQKIRYIYLIIICACAWSGQVWGGVGQLYVLNESAKQTLGYRDAGQQMTLSGPGSMLSFDVYHQTASGFTPQVRVEYKKKESDEWKELCTYNTTTTLTSHTCSVDNGIRLIRFVNNSGTLKRYVSNVKVSRATILTADNVSFPDTPVGITGDETLTVSYSNGYDPQTFSARILSGNDYFTVKSVSPAGDVTNGEGTIEVTFSFTPPSAQNYEGKAELKLGDVTKNITLTGTGKIEKVDPSFTWDIPSTVYTGRMYTNAFRTSNHQVEPTITVLPAGMENYVQYSDGNLYFSKTGSVSIRFHQDETANYKEYSETRSFTIEEPQNHVEFKIDTEAKFNTFVVEKNKSNDYYGFENDKGMRLGTTDLWVGASETSDKYVIIEFSGIPDKLSFTTSTAGAATSVVFYVQELNENGVPIGQQWNSTSQANTVVDRQLQPATRKLKMCYSGNYWGFFKDIHVTERHELSIDKTNLHFGKNNVKGNTVTIQSFTLSHYNAGANITLTSSDGIYDVSPNVIHNSGKDLWGVQTVSVKCLNNVVGIHNATITIEDVNGGTSKLPNVVVNVTDTTWTTYYTQAAATVSGGGSAYITYDSGSANSATTTSTSIVNSGLVTTENASKTVYLRAVPADGYRFKRWQKGGSQVSTTATCSVSYDYNSESSSNPPTETYTAVFEPKTLILDPTTSPSYEAGKYAGAITLNRNLPAGYSTIALPFATTVVTLTGHEANDNDWVAQLMTVTYNAEDDYTLFFTKSEGGVIAANQPYVLHLGTAVPSPSWTDLTVGAATSMTVTAQAGYGNNVGADGTYASWSMSSNFMAGMSMEGLYGIVNSGTNNQGGQGGLKLGGSGSTLSAFSAYITPPTAVSQGSHVLRLRVAYVDTDGTTTYIDSPMADNPSNGPVVIYGPDGKRRPRLQPGLNIVHQADGSVKKVMY